MNLADLKKRISRSAPKTREFAGLTVRIENEPGTVRSGVGADGKKWHQLMTTSYGSIPRVLANDDEALDCYVSRNPNAKEVYIVHQNKANGSYDEDKCVLGSDSLEDARDIYLAHHNNDPKFIRSITSMPTATFKATVHRGTPGSIRWKRKQKRTLETPAIFAADQFESGWEEAKHPRDTGGKFSEVAGASVALNEHGVVSESPKHKHLVGKTREQVESHGSAPEKKPGYHPIQRNAAGAYAGSNPDHAERLKSLKLPPGWRGVHLSEDPQAKVQAVGKDDKGRTVYRRSAEATGEASKAKFARWKKFGAALPAIRAHIAEHPSEEAAVLRLIDKHGLRIGGTGDTKAEKQAYGATTLRPEHVIPHESGSGVRLKFTGKKGVDLDLPITEESIANDLKSRAKSGEKLYNTNDAKVRDFLHGIAPGFKVKDFRTNVAAETAVAAIKSRPAPTDERSLNAAIKQVSEAVAKKLGNTPKIALDSYIPPEVFTPWLAKVANLQQAAIIQKFGTEKGLPVESAAAQWIPKHAATFRKDFTQRHETIGKIKPLNESKFLYHAENDHGNAGPQSRSQARTSSGSEGNHGNGFLPRRTGGGQGHSLRGDRSGSGRRMKLANLTAKIRANSVFSADSFSWDEGRHPRAANGVWTSIGSHHVHVISGKIADSKGSSHLHGKTLAEARDIVAGEHEKHATEHRDIAEWFGRVRDPKTANKHHEEAKKHEEMAKELKATAATHRGDMPRITPAPHSEQAVVFSADEAAPMWDHAKIHRAIADRHDGAATEYDAAAHEHSDHPIRAAKHRAAAKAHRDKAESQGGQFAAHEGLQFESEDDPNGTWRMIGAKGQPPHGGTRVQISGSGEIEKGPKNLTHENVNALPKKSPLGAMKDRIRANSSPAQTAQVKPSRYLMSKTTKGAPRPPFNMQDELKSSLGLGHLTIPVDPSTGQIDGHLKEAYDWIGSRMGIQVGDFKVDPRTGHAVANVAKKAAGKPDDLDHRRAQAMLGERTTAHINPQTGERKEVNEPPHETLYNPATGEQSQIPNPSPATNAPEKPAKDPNLDFKGLGGSAITDNMYEMLLDKANRGETTEAGGPSTVLQVAKAIKARGGKLDIDSMKAIGNEVTGAKDKFKGPEFQNAMRGIIDKHAPSQEPVSIVKERDHAGEPAMTADPIPLNPSASHQAEEPATDPLQSLKSVADHITQNRVGGASTMKDFVGSAQFGADKKNWTPEAEKSLRQAVDAGLIDAIPRETYTQDSRRDDQLINFNGKPIKDFRLSDKGAELMRGHQEKQEAIAKHPHLDLATGKPIEPPPEPESVSPPDQAQQPGAVAPAVPEQPDTHPPVAPPVPAPDIHHQHIGKVLDAHKSMMEAHNGVVQALNAGHLHAAQANQELPDTGITDQEGNTTAFTPKIDIASLARKPSSKWTDEEWKVGSAWGPVSNSTGIPASELRALSRGSGKMGHLTPDDRLKLYKAVVPIIAKSGNAEAKDQLQTALGQTGLKLLWSEGASNGMPGLYDANGNRLINPNPYDSLVNSAQPTVAGKAENTPLRPAPSASTETPVADNPATANQANGEVRPDGSGGTSTATAGSATSQVKEPDVPAQAESQPSSDTQGNREGVAGQRGVPNPVDADSPQPPSSSQVGGVEQQTPAEVAPRKTIEQPGNPGKEEETSAFLKLPKDEQSRISSENRRRSTERNSRDKNAGTENERSEDKADREFIENAHRVQKDPESASSRDLYRAAIHSERNGDENEGSYFRMLASKKEAEAGGARSVRSKNASSSIPTPLDAMKQRISKKATPKPHSASSAQSVPLDKMSDITPSELAKRPWWEVQKLHNALSPTYGNAPNPRYQMTDADLKRRQEKDANAPKPEGEEVLAKKQTKYRPPAEPHAENTKPTKSGFPYGADEKRLAEQGKQPPSHTTRKESIENLGGNPRAHQDYAGGYAKMKQFVNVVPEFALNPKFTLNEKGQLEFKDGGDYKFFPQAIGVIVPSDAKPGDTIGVDPASIKDMKKGDVLIASPNNPANAPEFSADRSVFPSNVNRRLFG